MQKLYFTKQQKSKGICINCCCIYYSQGMAALIGEFNRRQQGLYFYNPRADVIAVLRGACGEDFQHVSTEEELSYLLYSSGGKK